MNLKLIVATHKPYHMPQDAAYLPVQAGAEGKPGLGFARDDAGEHISGRNAGYCELTALYWAWKNLDFDALGLVHYRRHFGRHGAGDRWKRVLSGRELERALSRRDVLLPRKRHYVIETNESQYAHAHHATDLQAARDALERLSPDYLPAFDRSMKKRSGHRFNMLVMTKPRLDAYCGWLFPILFDVEERLDLTGYSDYDRRVFGFLGERLLDVWLLYNDVRYLELPVLSMEPINWPKKIARFLKRKMGKQTAE